MLEISLGVGFFVAIVLLQVLIIRIARGWLVSTGNVKLTVNSERELNAPVGSKLLPTLAGNGLFVSSACGGGGTCGQCRV